MAISHPATIWVKRAGLAAVAALLVGGFIYALMPSPVAVDTMSISRGPLTVTIDEEGRTRVSEIYLVSTPTAGKLKRVDLHAGDRIAAAGDVVAEIEPAAPPLLDIRARSEIEAQAAAARAAVDLAAAELAKVQSELSFAESELQRALRLARSGTVPERTLDRARRDVDIFKAARDSAAANLELRRREAIGAEARLIGPEDERQLRERIACCVAVRSPVRGVVLDVVAESEQVLTPGAPIMKVGDPAALEIEVDLLSSDAVKVTPGAAVSIEAWGGDVALPAKVRRIEPSGFTKVSALGIEEQRVRAVIDFSGEASSWRRLGDGYRVQARIVVYSQPEALRVPLGALFRSGGSWAVFRVIDGRAVLTPVEIGQRNGDNAELRVGLAEGERIILHPSDRVIDGVSVAERS